jgi:hypothetical protein
MAAPMTEPSPRQFTLTLRCPAGADGPRLLAQLLKLAKRRFGFVCLLCAPEPAGPSPDAPELEDGAR